MTRGKYQNSYYADECFPYPSITFLKSKGYSVKHACDYKYLNLSDKEQLKKSKKLNMVLITINKRCFWQEKYNLTNHPGIIILETTSTDYININKLSLKALERLKNKNLKEGIYKVTYTKIIKRRKEKN